MTKVTSALGRPIQGVSQQPIDVRRDGQCSLQENMNPSTLGVLKQRPGTRDVGQPLRDVYVANSKVHHYRRGDGEEYFILFEPNKLPVVFDNKGNQQVLFDNTSNNDYLKVSNPKSSLEVVTIADFTFIINKDVPVAKRPEKSPALVNEALVYVQFATYGRYYQVIIDGVIAGQFQAPSGELPEHVFEVDTSKVASALVNGGEVAQFEDSFTLKIYNSDESKVAALLPPQSATYTGAKNPPDYTEIVDEGVYFIYDRGTFTPPGESTEYTTPYPGTSITIGYEVAAAGITNLPGFLVTQTGNVIHIRKEDGSDFTLETIDGADGQDLIAIKGLLTDVGKLPPSAPVGFTIKIQASGKADENGYWLKAIERGGNTVKWVETLAPEVHLGFDKTTLPYTLVREGYVAGLGTFSLTEGAWEDRDVGDDDSNPFPAIVEDGQAYTISTLGIMQNRLYLTAGESVSMSRSGSFFNLFKRTTQALADDDPVGGYADSNQVNALNHGVILDGDLVLFSSGAQFIIRGGDVITNDNFTISQTNSFETIPTAKPTASGESILFAFRDGKYSGIREYFTDSLTDTKRARPVTEHVNRYLEGLVSDMVSSPNVNLLLCKTTAKANEIYVYNWLWVGDEKVQSAWHKWVFPESSEVCSFHFSDDRLYFTIARNGELRLEYLEVNDTADSLLGYEVRLDRLVNASAVRTEEDGDIVYYLSDPYPAESVDDLVVLCGEGCFSEYIGIPLIINRSGSSLVTPDRISDSNEVSLLVGRKYTARYIPSTPVMRDFKERAIGIDELTLSRMYVNYESTGDVMAKVTSKSGAVRESKVNGRILGFDNNIVGFSDPEEGRMVVPILQKAKDVTVELYTDSHLPFELKYIEWSGQFNQRGRRV